MRATFVPLLCHFAPTSFSAFFFAQLPIRYMSRSRPPPAEEEYPDPPLHVLEDEDEPEPTYALTREPAFVWHRPSRQFVNAQTGVPHPSRTIHESVTVRYPGAQSLHLSRTRQEPVTVPPRVPSRAHDVILDPPIDENFTMH